jgi:hypothetical protein
VASVALVPLGSDVDPRDWLMSLHTVLPALNGHALQFVTL